MSLWGQISYKDLKGSWIMDNYDSAFYKSDTIIFLKSNSRIFCQNVNWTIQNRRSFNFSSCDCCIDPPKITASIYPERLKLSGNEIVIFRNHISLGKFEIISLSNVLFQESTFKQLKIKKLK